MFSLCFELKVLFGRGHNNQVTRLRRGHVTFCILTGTPLKLNSQWCKAPLPLSDEATLNLI